jgi:hypothetical protein
MSSNPLDEHKSIGLAAIARKAALIGYIPSGRSPLHFALSAFGEYLYISDSGAAQIQVVNVSTLPALTG